MMPTIFNFPSECSIGSVHCSRVTKILLFRVENTGLEVSEVSPDESSVDEVSLATPYTIRRFKTIIMVLEYIFPSIAALVW